MFKREFGSGALGAKRLGIVLSWLFCGLTLAAINFVSVPWVDEVGTTDTAANLALNGQWISHCWQYSYNLLHLFLLTVWIKVFGVTHFAVCALNVVLAGIACHVLLSIAYRRGWGLNSWAVALFCVLFWGGFRFSTIITNGRLDILAMLCTILLVDELAREEFRWLRIFIWSFLSMAAAVYQMPIVFAFALSHKMLARCDWRCGLQAKKAFALAIGAGSAFGVACLIYLTQHQLLRFVHTYFSFNATLAGAKEPFLSRVISAYMYDLSFFAILVIVVVVAMMSGIARRIAGYAVFVALIPLLQVCSGRCAEYYSWVSYLPVVVLALYCVCAIRHRSVVGSLLFASLLMATFAFYSRYQEHVPLRAKVAEYDSFVNGAQKDIVHDEVAFFDDLAYYAVVKKGRIVWRIRNSSDVSPREKFMRMLNAFVKDDGRRKLLLRVYERIQKDLPAVPGYAVDAVVDLESPILRNMDLPHRVLCQDRGFQLVELNH